MIHCSLLSGSLYGEEAANQLTFIVLGEEQGFLEPCGCTSDMLGGIARRQTALAQAIEKKPNALVLHNGGLLNQFGPQEQLKREVQIKDLNKIGVSVLGLAPNDLMLGMGSLILMQKRANFPILASNLIDAKGQISFEKEWSHEVVVENKKTTVRVFSLISESMQKEVDRYLGSIQIEPISEKLKSWKEEKKEGEFWILLFHGTVFEAQRLPLDTDLFDLMVYNQDGEIPFFQRMKTVNMLSTGMKGRYVLLADFDVNPPFNLINSQKIVLDSSYEKHSHGAELIGNYKLQLKKEKIAEKYPKVPWIEGATYVGSKRCIRCHKAEYNVWKKSKHAQAIKELVPENHHFDPECLQCHTTGFKFKGGFQNLKKTKPLGAVGCESCHGPRSLHIKNPKKFKNSTPSSATCLQCHDAENSPLFDFDTYWPKIKH